MSNKKKPNLASTVHHTCKKFFSLISLTNVRVCFDRDFIGWTRNKTSNLT